METRDLLPLSTEGLSTSKAKEILEKEGPNEIVPSQFESIFSELKKVLLDPMGLMLLGLAGLYFVLGYQTDAIILALAFIPVTGVDVLLEVRAHKALKALHSTLQPTAKVIRDGTVVEIPIKNIVVGDVVVFEEGQTLPADGKVIEVKHCAVNEAALTGESGPVEKEVGDPFFGGTTILKGRGLGRVEATGRKTRFGQIAKLLEETEDEETPLQKKVRHLVKRVLLVALGAAVLLLIVEKLRGQNWIESIITALTFGMASVPEEFPLVFTLYLSLGAWRLSRHGVLVKSLPSVETLGGVDVICTDKTGTLTEGKFQLESLISMGQESTEVIWSYALMACEKTIVDSMESAVVEKAENYLPLLNGWELIYDYPFELQGKHMSHVWRNEKGDEIISMKGAVEGVLEHCELSENERQQIKEKTGFWAGQGKRLLGLAYRSGPCSGVREEDEKKLRFVGFLIFDDPIRSSAKHAIRECQQAGISVKMLTGDHPLTAHAVADEIGLEHDHELLFTGNQLEQMSQDRRWEAFQKGAIFSRVLPEQKYEMVQALKAAGNVVAMTGDGINDAPALKLADIGISMGANATDVARSAAQMVLLKNDFKGIVEAVFEGRKIFSNLKRSFSYLVSFHVPVIVLAFVPPLIGWGDLLLPIHIVLLELIVHPVSAFGFENLKTYWGPKEKTILTKRQFLKSLIAGLLVSVVSLVFFAIFDEKLGAEGARSISLAVVLAGTLGFVWSESWPQKTRRLGLISLSLVLLTVGLMRWPAMGQIFHLEPLGWTNLLLAFSVGFISGIGVPTGIRTRVFTVKG